MVDQGNEYLGWRRSRNRWDIPGPYRGIGPKNYRRTDQRILEDIYERLTQNGKLDARNIQVEVHEGEVTLVGSVDSRASKRLAGDIADSVMGVVDVHNRLRIAQSKNASEKCADRNNVYIGMEVVGVHGRHLGFIHEVHQDYFVVENDDGETIDISYSACKSVDGQLRLKITIDEAYAQNRNYPHRWG